MRLVSSLGVRQAVLPPHERPHMPTLRALGFGATDASILEEMREKAPWLLPQVSSSASMWSANAATLSPSIDCIDTHMHISPANMVTMFHRSLEAEAVSRILRAIFPNPVFFMHHEPLPPSLIFSDEGAANYIRFCKTHNGPGVELFVYGQSYVEGGSINTVYPARQTLEASQAIARRHQLYPDHVVFTSQNPSAINAGVFHNDVISIGNQNLLLHITSWLSLAKTN